MESTLLVSNIDSQLTEDHLKKIFSAAVDHIPKNIEIIAREEEWYVARVLLHSTYVATQAKEALHGKVVLERELYVEFESRELKTLLEQEYNDRDNNINKLQMSSDYFKKKIEEDRNKFKIEKETQEKRHKLEIEKLERELEMEKELHQKRKNEVDKLQLEIKYEKEANVALKKANQINVEEYTILRKKLETTIDRLKILKQAVQAQIVATKNIRGSIMETAKTSSYDAFVEVHRNMVEIIDKAETWENSKKS